jgi:outer membrane protein TolC
MIVENKINMKKYFIIISLMALPFLGFTQETQNVFSLTEAIEYAKLHNYDYVNAQTDVEIAKKQVLESTALGLPQIDASISNENYIDIPVTMLPDFISPSVYGVNINQFGLTPVEPLPEETQYFPVSFGTKHNATAGVSVSQLLFSGEYLVALKASKTFLGQTEREKVRAEVLLVEQVSKSYWLILSLEDNLKVLDSSLVINKALMEETKALYEAGFAEDTDADQLNVIVSNLDASIKNLENEINTAYAYLKFYLGIDFKEEIQLTDRLEDVINQLDIDYLLASNFNLNENIDFLLFQKQKELVDLQVQLEKAAYLPTLSAFFSAQTNAQRSEFDFFDTKGKWYPTTVWGFQMNIPIWSSGNRYAKVQQQKLSYKKMEESEKQLSNSLNLQVQTARNNFSNIYNEYLNRKQNLELNVKIYQKTNIKFREGMASSFDLNQAQNNFVQANTDYTMSVMNLLQSKIELEKILTKTADQFEEEK